MTYKEEKVLRVIDCDYIRELRRNGENNRARELLQAYHDSKDRAKKEVALEIRREDHIINKFKEKKKFLKKLFKK